MANKKSLKPVILLPAPSVSNVIVDIGDAMYDFLWEIEAFDILSFYIEGINSAYASSWGCGFA